MPIHLQSKNNHLQNELVSQQGQVIDESKDNQKIEESTPLLGTINEAEVATSDQPKPRGQTSERLLKEPFTKISAQNLYSQIGRAKDVSTALELMDKTDQNIAKHLKGLDFSERNISSKEVAILKQLIVEKFTKIETLDFSYSNINAKDADWLKTELNLSAKNLKTDPSELSPSAAYAFPTTVFGLLSGLVFAAEKILGQKILDHTADSAGIKISDLLKSGAVGNSVIYGGLALMLGSLMIKPFIKPTKNPIKANLNAQITTIMLAVSQMMTHTAGAAILKSANSDEFDLSAKDILNNGELWKEVLVGASIIAGSIGGIVGMTKVMVNSIEEY